MTTAQDQQSRAEFEAWYIAQARKSVPALKEWSDDEVRDGLMRPRKNGEYRVDGAQQAWEAWQAARALPAGVEPVGEIVLFGRDKEVSWRKGKMPAAGAKLYTASQVLAMGRVPPGLQLEPVAGHCRFSGAPWAECSVEHVRMVLAAPQDWQGYEVRYLYAEPEVRALLASARAAPLDRIAVLTKIDAVLCKEKNPLQAAEEICVMAAPKEPAP